MAHHKSAIKRIKQSRKTRLYNRLYKKRMREAVKSVLTAPNAVDAKENFRKATSILDRLSAKGIVHKNYAANHKSKLWHHISKMQAV